VVRKPHKTSFVWAMGLLGTACASAEDMEPDLAASTSAEMEPPHRAPPPVAGVYVAIADQARVPASFEILDGDDVRLVAGDTPTILLIEATELPYRFSVRPRDNANPIVRLQAVVTTPGCHGVFMTERPPDPAGDPAPGVPAFVPSLAPPLDDARWLFNLGHEPLFIHEDVPESEPIATLPPGEGHMLAEGAPRWLQVRTATSEMALRWWALDAPHTMLIADDDGRIRHVGIEGPNACRVATGGVAMPIEPAP